ncbi:MAG: hypothetical protein E7477_06945 [Ruminococcaceae bacterium]|nr:hypothetical protein [Oscillospiraceae bacterium]
MSKSHYYPKDCKKSACDFQNTQSKYEPVIQNEQYICAEKRSDGISDKILSAVKELSFDDILIIAVFILLFNENKQDDFLILLILAVLFFS